MRLQEQSFNDPGSLRRTIADRPVVTISLVGNVIGTDVGNVSGTVSNIVPPRLKSKHISVIF